MSVQKRHLNDFRDFRETSVNSEKILIFQYGSHFRKSTEVYGSRCAKCLKTRTEVYGTVTELGPPLKRATSVSPLIEVWAARSWKEESTEWNLTSESWSAGWSSFTTPLPQSPMNRASGSLQSTSRTSSGRHRLLGLIASSIGEAASITRHGALGPRSLQSADVRSWIRSTAHSKNRWTQKDHPGSIIGGVALEPVGTPDRMAGHRVTYP